MSLRLMNWYNRAISYHLFEKQLYTILVCVKSLNVTVPNFILIKILENTLPAIFTCHDNSNKFYESDDPMITFVNDLGSQV